MYTKDKQPLSFIELFVLLIAAPVLPPLQSTSVTDAVGTGGMQVQLTNVIDAVSVTVHAPPVRVTI